MIKHTVCFKLLNPTNEEKSEAKKVLLSMIGKAPSAVAVEVGTDFLGSPRSYDVVLTVTLADAAALDVYQADEYHCSVVKKYMHAHVASSVAVDYEI